MSEQPKIERLKLFVVITIAVAALALLIVGARSPVEATNKPYSSIAESDGNNAQVEKVQVQNPTQSQTKQTEPEAKPEGCMTCHAQTEAMHTRYTQKGAEDTLDALGRDGQNMTCTSCHGGNPVATTIDEAHVRPRLPNRWQRRPNGTFASRNPEESNELLAQESYEFVRFINPGDNRVAAKTCGSCHATESANVPGNMMSHGAMLWGAALYNNGSFPLKDSRFGESYTRDGRPQRLIRFPYPTPEESYKQGILAYLDPIPPWQISQPGNVLRVFERGGRRRLEVGLPDREEEPGKPDKGLSPRGFGTNNRTDPVFLGLQKTRLHDPNLNFLGTNNHPGDFRSSGCSSCHVIYANDRSFVHSGSYAKYGHTGQTDTRDASIPRGEEGHPIKHQFTNKIPSSQCMTCHMHPGTNMVASYYGVTWWDNESDGDKMYPKEQHDPSQEEEARKFRRNPEGSSARGFWSERGFLDKTGTPEFNKNLKHSQFADFHGHGWVYRAVFKKNRKGELLDADDKIVSHDDPQKFDKAVHLKDIHLEKGMHCADCHFRQDTHGNGNLYNEPRAAIEITCADCHGTIRQRASLVTSGPAAGQGLINGKVISNPTGRDLGKRSELSTRDARGREIAVFQRATPERPISKKNEDGTTVEFKNGEIIQNSTVEFGKWWRVSQTLDSITPGTEDYNEQSRYAKTMRTGGKEWGNVPANDDELAHRDSNMTCYICHSSWVTSCFGCHLSMKANRKMPNRHNEGGDTRNFTTYNFQVLRDDIFMLGREGTASGLRNADGTIARRIAPVRSSSAVLVGSQNQNREWIYSQQQTVSAEGFSGQAFNTHVPHTVRGKETKTCSECHLAQDPETKKINNNAWMAQLFLQGTNFVNFVGQYAYVAAEDALEVVRVTEAEEPQAVLGSTLHKIAYPKNYAKFERDGRALKTFFEHKGNPKVLGVQVRGEYAYVAAGEGGLRIYDVAQIDHKGFSERIVTAPVSPLGQRFYVDTKYCTSVAAPTTLAVDPARWRMKLDGTMMSPTDAAALWQKSPLEARRTLVNEEQPIHPLYAYLFLTDREEGLILVNVATALDGDPLNNFLKRDLTYNPEGKLTGANNITIAGTFAYITTERGLVVIDLSDPLKPEIVAEIGAPALVRPTSVAIQFRYGFIADAEGLKVIDVTSVADKRRAGNRVRVIENAKVPLKHARDVYVARTYAYVADGSEGIAIIDVEQPERPTLDRQYNADGKLNDAHQVKVAMTNASLFAYVADGHNGLRVLQLTSPETDPAYGGFSPRPNPRLIATFHTHGDALAVSKGLDRDRAVDESGNQIAVFGRRGARPLNLTEMRRMYMRGSRIFTVTDTPQTEPLPINAEVSDTNAGDGKPSKPSDSGEPSDKTSWKIFGIFPTFSPLIKATGTPIIGFGLFVFAFVFIRWRMKTGR